ncbi:sigma-70 family RNA polymerase sigma factor [Planctomycetales bacterium ZRK34]|nr:sigma-70 family RNA polymerase sigma factor [Planctomycetales bacterium ZRK34]
MALSSEQFVSLITAHQRDLYRYIHAMSPTSVDADDLYQEAVMALYADRDRFEAGSNFLAWACTVARFKIMAHRTSARRDRLQFSGELVERLSARWITLNSGELAHRRAALDHCLDRLPARQRELIDQRYGSDLAISELARRTGRSVHTLYKTLNRVRQSLAECINRELARARS